MVASVLNSQKAVEVSVLIVRALVELRRAIIQHKELSQQILKLERRLTKHDEQIYAIVKAIRQLTNPQPVPKKRRIGFKKEE